MADVYESICANRNCGELYFIIPEAGVIPSLYCPDCTKDETNNVAGRLTKKAVRWIEYVEKMPNG